jgi:hypothetical protein
MVLWLHERLGVPLVIVLQSRHFPRRRAWLHLPASARRRAGDRAPAQRVSRNTLARAVAAARLRLRSRSPRPQISRERALRSRCSILRYHKRLNPHRGHNSAPDTLPSAPALAPALALALAFTPTPILALHVPLRLTRTWFDLSHALVLAAARATANVLGLSNASARTAPWCALVRHVANLFAVSSNGRDDATSGPSSPHRRL